MESGIQYEKTRGDMKETVIEKVEKSVTLDCKNATIYVTDR